MRWLGLFVALALLLAAATAAIAAWLLTTDGGAKLLSAQLTEQFPEFEVGEISGNLLSGLQIDRFTYSGEVIVELRKVELELDVWLLIDLQALNIRSFKADRVSVEITPTPVPSQAPLDLASLEIPVLPLELYVESAQIGKLHIQQTAQAFEVDAINFTAAWTKAGLRMSGLRLKYDEVTLDARVLVSSQSNPTHIDLATSWFLADLRGQLTAKGSLSNLAVEHRLHAPSVTPVASVGQVSLAQWPMLSAQLKHTIDDPSVMMSTNISGEGADWHVQANGRVMGYSLASQQKISLGDRLEVAITEGVFAKTVNFSGQVSYGDDLQVHMDLFSEDIAPLQLEVEGDLAAKVDWTNNRIKVTAVSQHLSAGQLEAQNLNVVADGPLDELTFKSSWHQGKVAGVAYLMGEQTRLNINRGATLSLSDYELISSTPFTITGRGTLWSATPHCWSGFGELCIEESEVSKDAATMRGRVTDLELSVFNDFEVAAFDPTSRMSGQWSWQVDGDDWQAEVEVATKDLQFVAAQRTFDWLPDVTLSAAVRPGMVAIQATAMQPGLSWQAQLESDGWAPTSGIRGDMRLALDGPTLLEALPELAELVQRFEGNITGEVALAGSIEEPQISAHGDWTGGSLEWRDPQLALHHIETQWWAARDGWRLQGNAQSDQGGALTLSGTGDGYDVSANIEADILSSGLNLKSPLWELTAVPHMRVVAKDGLVRFDGEAQVPQARVTVKTLPSALPKPVADVKVSGRPERSQNGENAFISGQLKVSLGQDVRLDLLALSVRLTGDVVAQVKGTEVVALHGELTVADGSLNANGQTLKVKEGRILFSGDPALPYVDLVATREIRDQAPPLEVGLRVSGRADSLKTNVYSSPVMSETRALSFLVLGRDFNEASDADSGQLLSAAISLGLSQTQGVVEQLRGVLGLDELSALAAEQNDVAIVAGKKITEDLYVRYSYNALSAVSALIIRYHVTDRWRLEVTNDVNSSMDLLYEFSR